MSDCSLSPKRKASCAIGSPSKRMTWATCCDKEERILGVPKGDMSSSIDTPPERTIPDLTLRIHPVWRPINRYPIDADSSSGDTNDTATTIDNDGPLLLYDGKSEIPTPPSEEGYDANLERCIPSVILQGLEDNNKDAEFPALDDSAEDDTEEFGFLLSSKEYVELQVSISVTRCQEWAKVIDVSCTYGGVEVASASGHLISRELIRGSFYDSMEALGKPASDRIDELLDHHGYFRWSIKEYYVRKMAGTWNHELDTGSFLQIDEVLVNKEWQGQALSALMVTSLIDRAEKRDCGAKFACVLPSTGCFWKVKDTGIKAFDKNQSWAEQNHVCLFLGVGFSRVAETAWFVLDIIKEDEDGDEELEESGLRNSEQKILMAGMRKK
jgi:hypothetical protein